MQEKKSMSWYFDIGLSKGALLLDASNLDWFDFPLFLNIKKEIYRTLEDPTEDMDWGYSYPGGKNKLRELIALHESFLENVDIQKKNVIVGGNGVTGVLNFVAQFLCKKGKELNKNEIIYPQPAYAGLLKSLDYYSFDVKKIKTQNSNGFIVTYEEIKNAISDNTLAVLITNPGNPVCNFMSKEEFYKIVDICIKKDIYIIWDAIFEESPKTNYVKYNVFKKFNYYDKLIKIKGFSKDIPQLSDLRLGWSISFSDEFNNEMLELSEITNYSNSTFLEALGIVEMQHRVGVDQKINNESINTYIEEKKNYWNKINDIKLEAINYLKSNKIISCCFDQECGNIIFARVNDIVKQTKNIKTNHDLFVYIMKKCNILITPGHVFGTDINELWFRVTVSRNKNDFLNGLKKICETLGEDDE